MPPSAKPRVAALIAACIALAGCGSTDGLISLRVSDRVHYVSVADTWRAPPETSADVLVPGWSDRRLRVRLAAGTRWNGCMVTAETPLDDDSQVAGPACVPVGGIGLTRTAAATP